LIKNGGSFKFYLSYVSKISGQESEISKEFIVKVSAIEMKKLID